METPKISQIYNNCNRIILIPSLSALKDIIKQLKFNGADIRSGPPLLDCYQPYVFIINSAHNVLIGPFMGASAIPYLIKSFGTNKIKEIIFIGSCGFFGEIKSLDEYKSFENKPIFPVKYLSVDIFKNELNFNLTERPNTLARELDKPTTISSMPSPTFNDLNTARNIINKYQINLFDMEAAFIAETCLHLGINFGCGLVLTDHQFTDQIGSYNLRQVTKIPSYSTLIQHLIKHLKLAL